MTYQQEHIKPYSNTEEKASQVEQMFDNIAPAYDKLNHRLSWNIDRGWRRKAIKALAPYEPQTMLDIATGTGDFAILAAQMLKPKTLVGADISEGMMAIGRQSWGFKTSSSSRKKTAWRSPTPTTPSMPSRQLSAFATSKISTRDFPRCVAY